MKKGNVTFRKAPKAPTHPVKGDDKKLNAAVRARRAKMKK